MGHYNDMYDPAEEPSIRVIGNTKPIAKKDYFCSLCHGPIAKGTKHRKVVYIDDDEKGKLVSIRSHLPFCGFERGLT